MRVRMGLSQEELNELIKIAISVKYPDLATMGKMRFDFSSYSDSTIYFDPEEPEEQEDE